MSEVNGKIVIVTGGANGIGACTVKVFAEENAKHIAILDVDEKSGVELEKLLNTKYGSGKAKFYKCDVTKEEELFSAFENVLQTQGYIDVVVNNAATSLENSIQNIKKLVEINVTALIISTLKAIELMRIDKGGKGGTVVNISSIAALKQFCPSVFVYLGTKSAVLQFSNCIGKQPYFSKTGVRVVTVCYGPTDTDFVPQMINIDDAINPDISRVLTSQKLQTGDSAARGLLEAFKKGASGSTWLVFDAKTADITSNIDRAYDIIANNLIRSSIAIGKSFTKDAELWRADHYSAKFVKMYDFKDKVVIVTGGAAGIGAGIVKALLKEEAKHIAILDIDAVNGKLLEEELNRKYKENTVKFHKCDVTNNELEDTYDNVVKEQKYIDIVVNCAGIMNDRPNVYLKEIAVNVTALITSSFKAYNLMRKDHGGNGGTIINISSIVGLFQATLLPVYAATKSAVLQFSTCLGMEPHYSRSGVRVLTLCFGCTDTTLFSSNKLGAFDKETDLKLEKSLGVLPMQTPESAVKGLLYAYKEGKSGSTWLITSNRPAEDITENITKGFQIMSQGVFLK